MPTPHVILARFVEGIDREQDCFWYWTRNKSFEKFPADLDVSRFFKAADALAESAEYLPADFPLDGVETIEVDWNWTNPNNQNPKLFRGFK